MATYTDANGVKLITTGDEAGTWGSSTNVNLQILDRAANGFESIALSSTTYTLTLSAQPSSAEDGHYKAIKFTGSPGGTCTVTLDQNDKARVYMILNSTDANLIITQGSGGNVTIEVGKGSIVLADGAGSGAAVTDFTAAVQNVTDLSSPFNVGATSVTTSGAELNLLDGSAAGTIANSKAVIYGSSGEVNATTLQIAGTSITATAAELNYVDGVTSAIQTQIDAKQPLGTVAVTVAGGKFVIDGTSQQTVEIKPSVTYRFDQSDGSNASHPLKFSTTSDGTHGGGSPFTTGVTVVGTPGSAGAYTQVKLEQDAPTVLYYYCVNHSGMGGKAVVRMSDLTASRVLISDSGGDIAVSDVTTTELDILDGLTASTAELNIMDGVTATTAELNYVDGVTSAIQTQIDSKQATITGAATTIDDADLTASRAVISNASGKVAVSDVTDTELGYLDGVTSAIQTQIDSKQATITGAATTIDDSDLIASRAVISNASGKVAVSDVTTTELDILDGLTASTAELNIMDGVTATTSELNIMDGVTATTSELNIMDGVTATTAELNYVDGVTSAIQTQIDSKQATITGAATTIDDADLTASRAVISNASGKVAVSAVTDTELGYLDGVTSAIQTQIDSKQATITGAATTIDDADLTASRVLVSNSSGKVAVSSTTTTELGNFIDGSSLNASNLDSGTVNDARLPATISSDITGNAATATTAASATTAAALTGNVTKTGDFKIDASGDIYLDADGDQVYLQGGGSTRGAFTLDTSNTIKLDLNIAGSLSEKLRITSAGLNSLAGLRVGDATSPTDNDIHAVGDISADGIFKLSGGSSDWTFEVLGTNELFIKFGSHIAVQVPTGSADLAYLGVQAASTWNTGTGTVESVISPAKLKSTIDNQLNVSGSAPIYGVRAWVNFVGNGSSSANATLNGSGNIATVYKTGTGNFTATFTTALPDANYAITFAAGVTTSASANDGTCIDVYAQSASAFSFTVTDPSGNNYANPHTVMITVVR